MDYNEIINNIKLHIKNTFSSDTSGHDWHHIFRVWQTARYIAEKEKADLVIVEIAALLHDISDWKFNGGDDKANSKEANTLLLQLGVSNEITQKVCNIIDLVSFKGANVNTDMPLLEGKIVQDADRLDAIGAIGVARTFAYGGYSGRKMYDPDIIPQSHDSFLSYKNSKGTTINHFYEKLLLLKDRMQTKTGKKLAEEKHKFMEHFLKQFLSEWNCNL